MRKMEQEAKSRQQDSTFRAGRASGASRRGKSNAVRSDAQESLLFLPRITSGKAAIHEKLLRPIAAEIDWGKQREMWAGLKRV